MYAYQVSNSYGDFVTGDLSDCQSEAYRPSSDCTDKYKYASAGDDMYWRIVRINGDGTLRLMYIGTSVTTEKTAGQAPFNRLRGVSKYLGYTYDNSVPDAGDGTASSMKTYLETWYSKNMNSEDANIANAQFYNDTTFSNHDRLNKYDSDTYGNIGYYTQEVSPTLKTSATTNTYGGRYYLKVGLLNADELVLSGFDGVLGTQYFTSTYTSSTNTSINSSNKYWTFTPSDGSNMFYVDTENNYVSDTLGYSVHLGVVPVINLTKEYARSLVWDSANGYYVAN